MIVHLTFLDILVLYIGIVAIFWVGMAIHEHRHMRRLREAVDRATSRASATRYLTDDEEDDLAYRQRKELIH